MSETPATPRSGRDPAATRQRWADRLHRFRTAGRSVVAFCAAEGVSVPSFYQWKRRLTRTGPPTDGPTLIPVRITTPTPAGPGVELTLPSGAAVRFPADTRPEVIVAILRGVEGRPC